MKVLIAPDSFKECMNAYEACLAIQEGLYQGEKNIITSLCPLADGGEGTLETLMYAMKGKIEYYKVHGPLMNIIQAPIGFVDNIAIIECAKVCGLELLNENQKNPYQTTSYGLGELIQHALNQEVKHIIICLGGSATNDGGIGMLQALGVRFFNQYYQNVVPTMKGLFDIQDMNQDLLDSRLKNVSIIGVCDVTNPLCGCQGATYIYGPQKGVALGEREMIDQAMKNYAYKVKNLLQCDYMNFPSTGAAGGLGFALKAFLNATLEKGFDVVSTILHLEEFIQDSDVIIVGEGKIDRQTQYGKTPYGVLKIAQKYHKDVFAFAGKVEDLEILKELGFKNVYQITPKDMDLCTALKMGKENLKECVYQHIGEIL